MTAFVIFAYSAELVAVKRWALVAMTKSGEGGDAEGEEGAGEEGGELHGCGGSCGMWD